MKKIIRLLPIALMALLIGWQVGAAENPSESPVTIAVMEFNTIDRIASDILRFNNKLLPRNQADTLTPADRQSIDNIMQGYIRMIDARDNAADSEFNRQMIASDNRREWERRKMLYDQLAKSKARPAIIGAEYMIAALGAYPETISVVVPELTSWEKALQSEGEEISTEDKARGAALLGAQYLLIGTVSDLRTKEGRFKGYGVEINRITEELDLVVKLVDLRTQRTVFSKVVTGRYSHRETANMQEKDSDVYTRLMTDATDKVADALHEHFVDKNQASKEK